MSAPIGPEATVASIGQSTNICADPCSNFCSNFRSWAPLLRRTIDALVASDAVELQRLTQCSLRLQSLPEDAEQAEAFALHKLLGALLVETRRNLHLLRRTAASRPVRTYGSIDA